MKSFCRMMETEISKLSCIVGLHCPNSVRTAGIKRFAGLTFSKSLNLHDGPRRG